jgi:hypothetical protein
MIRPRLRQAMSWACARRIVGHRLAQRAQRRLLRDRERLTLLWGCLLALAAIGAALLSQRGGR